MLNKTEKFLFENEILPMLKKLLNIGINYEELYPEELSSPTLPESSYNKLRFPYWNPIGDMFGIALNIQTELKKIYQGTFVKNVDWKVKWKQKESQMKKQRKHEDQIKLQGIKEGTEQTIKRAKKIQTIIKNKHNIELIKTKSYKPTKLDNKILFGKIQMKFITYTELDGMTEKEAWIKIKSDM